MQIVRDDAEERPQFEDVPTRAPEDLHDGTAVVWHDRPILMRQEVDHRALARSVRPENRGVLALTDRQREAVQYAHAVLHNHRIIEFQDRMFGRRLVGHRSQKSIIISPMRYAMFSTTGNPTPRLGVVRNDVMIDVGAQLSVAHDPAPASLLALIEAGRPAWARLERSLSASPVDAGAGHSLDEVRWHAPIPRPRKNVICLGLNYISHVVETSKSDKPKIPELPLFFTKAPTTVNGPYDPVPWDPSATSQVDYEAELGVIVGTGGKNISRSDALSHVFGYTVINDVSARDVQFGHKQWFKGKSLDGFCPMGPLVVTADEFGDPQNKHITLRVNGDTRQDATTRDMIFPVDVILEFLSKGMTIEAGDVIATGTPE